MVSCYTRVDKHEGRQIDKDKDKVIDAYLLVESVAGEGDEGGGDEDGVPCKKQYRKMLGRSWVGERRTVVMHLCHR